MGTPSLNHIDPLKPSHNALECQLDPVFPLSVSLDSAESMYIYLYICIRPTAQQLEWMKRREGRGTDQLELTLHHQGSNCIVWFTLTSRPFPHPKALTQLFWCYSKLHYLKKCDKSLLLIAVTSRFRLHTRVEYSVLEVRYS